MPIGILGSLVVCTILYILVSTVLTGLVNYRSLDVSDPVAVGIDVTGVTWGSLLVKIGAVFGLGTVMLVMLLGQSRVFYSMSKDGLLWKWASAVHPKFRTPWISNIVVGTIVAFLPALLPIDKLAALVNMGTLLAFTIVCAGVWILRRRHPNMERPFRTPSRSAGPHPWHVQRLLSHDQASSSHLGGAHRLADHWLGHLFQLQHQAQQSAGDEPRGDYRPHPLASY